MAPDLVGLRRAAREDSTDVWWMDYRSYRIVKRRPVTRPKSPEVTQPVSYKYIPRGRGYYFGTFFAGDGTTGVAAAHAQA